MVNFGMNRVIGANPLAIEVNAGKTRSVITSDDAIGVEAWNQFKYEILPQELNIGVVDFREHVKDALEDEAGVRLSRMHSRGY